MSMANLTGVITLRPLLNCKDQEDPILIQSIRFYVCFWSWWIEREKNTLKVIIISGKISSISLGLGIIVLLIRTLPLRQMASLCYWTRCFQYLWQNYFDIFAPRLSSTRVSGVASSLRQVLLMGSPTQRVFTLSSTMAGMACLWSPTLFRYSW